MKHHTLNNLIREMQSKFPSLFFNRTRALNHLYLVIGNGYEWNNGRLATYEVVKGQEKMEWVILNEVIPEQPQLTNKQYKAKSLREQTRINTPPPSDKIDKETWDKTTELVNQEYIRQAKEIENGPELPEAFYPLSREYSAVCNMPDDATEDFVAGALEITKIAVKHGHQRAELAENYFKLKQQFPQYQHLFTKKDDKTYQLHVDLGISKPTNTDYLL